MQINDRGKAMALCRLAVLAKAGAPLPDAINATVSTMAELDELARNLTAAGEVFEQRSGDCVRELVVPLGDLTYRVRWYGPAADPTMPGATRREVAL
ncbi:hypothetical protein [Streptosporangium sp. V21-05]|uniref:hypothetical protein n=1 Tax=Streptosporangium sp. V21-05 TaxID=3446115 RepID=UPI003F52B2CC